MMARALIIVLDSVGFGARRTRRTMVMPGRTRCCTSRGLRLGRGGSGGAAHGAAESAGMAALGFRILSRRRAAKAARGLAGRPPRRPVGLRRRDLDGKDTPSGHWEIAGVPGRFRLGLFPGHAALLPAVADRGADPRGGAARNPRRQACLGHGISTNSATSTCARKADLLHVGRQRAADRGARGDFRAGAALRCVASRAGSAIRCDIGRVIARPFVGAREMVSRAPPTARTSPFRRRTARSSTACAGGRRGRRRSARSATSSPIAAPDARSSRTATGAARRLLA